MQPTQQPTDLASILKLLAGSAQQAQGNAQSFGDMLRQRREFVQGAENGVVDQAQGAIQGGSNGVPVSPAALNTPALNYHTDNANQTANLTQQSFGYQNQANDLLKALADYAGQGQSRSLQQQQLELDKHASARADFQSGFDSTGSGTGSNAIGQWADSVQQGYVTPDKIPAGLQRQVTAELQKRGYQPGAADAKTRAGVEGLSNILEKLKKDASDVKLTDILTQGLPDSKMAQFNQRKNLAGQLVTRLFEKGTLSDKDRAFYLDQVANISPFGGDKEKNAKIDKLLSDIKDVTGYNRSGTTQGAGASTGNSRYQIVEVK